MVHNKNKVGSRPLRGVILRSKIKRVEKTNKYFLNPKKHHYIKETISQLKVGDKKFATQDLEILCL